MGRALGHITVTDVKKAQQVVLGRALRKANTAVSFDNAENYGGAIAAYADACELLQQVMMRSTKEDEKGKLHAIRIRYFQRMVELMDRFSTQTIISVYRA